MIIKMKKAVLLCMEQDKITALEKLRELGVLQVEYAKSPDTESVGAAAKNIADAERAHALITGAEGKDIKDKSPLSGGEIVERVNALFAEQGAVRKELDSLTRDREKLIPWGNFDPEMPKKLRSQGIYVYLCASTKKTYSDDVKKYENNVTVEEVRRHGEFVYYAVFSTTEVAPELLSEVQLPAMSLDDIENGIARAEKSLKAINDEFVLFKKSMSEIREYIEKETENLEFASARDGMADAGEIAYIYGYVPVTSVDVLEKAASENGWALSLEDPAADDDHVPTLIKKPAFLNVMDPLFDFIGVAPGYRENDVNVFFLLFFPIFFGMIIGDAGYAVIFIVAAYICKIFFRKVQAARLPLNLLLLLSYVTLIWGWLNGSWCGIPREYLPGFMQGCNFIAEPNASPAAHCFAKYVGLITDSMSDKQITGVMADFENKFVQFICFALACLHLASARIFKFFDEIRHTWRAFGHIGWALLIVANSMMAISLIVYPGTFPEWGMYLYIAGVALVTVTISGAGALNLPFSLIGSFVDVLSYIRLFAVGLAGAYISEKFNEMGAMIADGFSGWAVFIGYILLILVAVFGNVLNIALGFLGVLVHAVRLNTLEFSNHIEMQWTGYKFRPFEKKQK